LIVYLLQLSFACITIQGLKARFDHLQVNNYKKMVAAGFTAAVGDNT
jgi:hypothetical protein